MVTEKWISAHIKDIAMIYGRIGFRGYTKQDIVKPGFGAISLSPSNIKDGRVTYNPATYISWEKYDESPEIKLKNGDVVLVKTGSTFGKTAYIDRLPCPTTLNPQIVVFKSIAIHPQLFSYFMASDQIQKQIRAVIVGGAIPTLSQEQVYAFDLIYPPDREEQTAIAEALSNMDSLISSLQRLIEKKKAIKQGAMQELLTGKKRLPGFSGEWNETSFADLFGFLPTNAFTRDQMTDTGTIKNIHYGDILTKYGACLDISNTNVPYLSETVSAKRYSESSYARSGDVIIADTAEDTTVGKCIELVNVCGKVLSGQHTMLCRPKVSFAPKFLGYYMNADCFHNQMLPFITGIKVSSISKTNVSVLKLKYPSSIEEQQGIAQVLSDMDSEIEQLEKKLAKCQQIKQGMMQELLTGRIRLV